MTHHAIVHISPELDAKTYDFVHANRGTALQPRDETVTVTARFDDERQADVKCCSADGEPSWTEMVLFDANGAELAFTEPDEQFAGTWRLDYDGDAYVVHVVVGSRADRLVAVSDGSVHALVECVDPHLGPGNLKARLADAAKSHVGDLVHFRGLFGHFPFGALVRNCPADTYAEHGFRMAEISEHDPIRAQVRNVSLDPEQSLLVDDDFLL